MGPTFHLLEWVEFSVFALGWGYLSQAVQSKLEYPLENNVLNGTTGEFIVTVKWLKNRESLGSDQMPLVRLGKDLAFPLMGKCAQLWLISTWPLWRTFSCLSRSLDFTSFLKTLHWPLLCLVSINLKLHIRRGRLSEVNGLSVAFHYSYLLFRR